MDKPTGSFRSSQLRQVSQRLEELESTQPRLELLERAAEASRALVMHDQYHWRKVSALVRVPESQVEPASWIHCSLEVPLASRWPMSRFDSSPMIVTVDGCDVVVLRVGR